MIVEELKLKNKKEAILEFLRTPLDGENSKFLIDVAYEGKLPNDLKSVDPYN